MSDVSINQVLAQMRAINDTMQIDSGQVKPPSADFGQILSESINKVAETQNQAAEMSKAFQTGDNSVELPEVMIALQKASISFEAMTQVRNKLLSAYQEIMRMPV
ncbi:MAG: flagellar hook-basal body complex protein FliE [Candidatus Azotimanducaceae bacterium]|jgi:flagellar hook-basal body complex protein FliE